MGAARPVLVALLAALAMTAPAKAQVLAFEELDGWAEPVTHAGFVRTHPGQIVPGDKGGTLDGFFVARFIRR